ncbi:hypothetical protein PMAYCL1PPCAC_00557, partial [Pristionchus mayeri]
QMNLYLARKKKVLSKFQKRLYEVKKKCKGGSSDSRQLAWDNREKMWRCKRKANQMKTIERMKENNEELINFLQKDEPFPLLCLPNELISHVFSFLLMRDRLRARV